MNLEAIEKRMNEIVSEIESCTDMNKLKELSAEYDSLEESRNAILNARAKKPVEPTVVNVEKKNPLVPSTSARTEEKDPYATIEYRTAFMKFVQKGVKSDILVAEKRNNDRNVASDLGVLLPTTVIQEIMKQLEGVYGQLYSRVKKTNIKGGVKYPIGSFSAVFHRITETGAPSDRQKAGGVTGYVEFSYNIGEIRLAQTLLMTVLSVDVFEKELANVIVKTYLEAMDKEIMTGDPTNLQCEGILTHVAGANSRIPADHVIEFTEEEMSDWKSWQKKLFAVIPLAMRGLRPEFVMTANTYEANIKTLADDNNRPVYAETFNPVDGTEKATFKGREVIFVENDIVADFDDAEDGDVFGIYWVPEKGYAINTNLEFYVKRYFDEEKNEWVSKALVINDGKVLDGQYIYLLKKSVGE